MIDEHGGGVKVMNKELVIGIGARTKWLPFLGPNMYVLVPAEKMPLLRSGGITVHRAGTPAAKHLTLKANKFHPSRNFLHARVVMRRPTHNTAKLPRQLLEELGVNRTNSQSLHPIYVYANERGR